MPQSKTRRGNFDIETLEDRTLYSITTSVEYVKIPGPTDVQLTVATNPAGKQVPGQSSTATVSNRVAHTS